MAKIPCRCGNILRDDDPTFSGRLLRNRNCDVELDSVALVGRSYEVWGCPICDRLWIFWERLGGKATEYVRHRPSAEESARRIEAERDVILTPSRDPAVDWVDERGATYVVIGNFPDKYFDQEWPHLQTRIREHLTTADVVAVDVSAFTPQQIAEVRQFIAPLDPAVLLVGA